MIENPELAFAVSLAHEAGEVMQKHFRDTLLRPDWKAENDAVTIADTSINTLVIEKVKKAFPEHGVIGEESSYEPNREIVWMVDPLDGTLPYSVGLPIAAFLLAKLVKGRPELAIAYSPWADITYAAIEGQGAYLDGRELNMQEGYTKFVELILWKGSPHKARLNGVKDKLEGQGYSPQNWAGGISRFAVTQGKLYGVIYSDASPWDMAALDLIVTEAGGKVTDLDGNQIDYRSNIKGGIAGSAEAHEHLLGLVHS